MKSLVFIFPPGDDNPALSKHWGYTQIKSMLFWRGDTANMADEYVTFWVKGE
jgi:hypothetical protein